jgi:cysteine synthase
MPRLRVGVSRYLSVANRIAASLGVDPAPEVAVGGRVRIIFRSIGASRWPEAQQVDYALQVASVARQAMAADTRRLIRRRALGSAIVVVFEDATLRRGCSIVAKWECVVTASGIST